MSELSLCELEVGKRAQLTLLCAHEYPKVPPDLRSGLRILHPLQILLKPVNRIMVEVNIGVHVVVLIEIDGSEFETLWKRTNVHLSNVVKVAQEHVCKHDG